MVSPHLFSHVLKEPIDCVSAPFRGTPMLVAFKQYSTRLTRVPDWTNLTQNGWCRSGSKR